MGKQQRSIGRFHQQSVQVETLESRLLLAGQWTRLEDLVSDPTVEFRPSMGNVELPPPVQLGDVLYAFGRSHRTGWGLYRTDGTKAGTCLVKDLIPDVLDMGLPPTDFFAANGMLFFVYEESSAFGFDYHTMWRSDGTTAGTLEVQRHAFLDKWVPAMGKLFYTLQNSSGLWVTDGTPGGTTQVLDHAPSAMVEYKGMLYLFSDMGPRSVPWLLRSDGTAAGTVPVMMLDYGTYYSRDESTVDDTPVVVNDTLYFAAGDPANGCELWKSDGTASGTAIVKDLNTTRSGGYGSDSAEPRSFTNVNGTLFFVTDISPKWGIPTKSDGTEEGTTTLDRWQGPWNAEDLRNVNGVLYFTAMDRVHGNELWRSDGTWAGTYMVRDINHSITDYSTPYTRGAWDPVWFNGSVYFVGAEPDHGSELWRTDGTEAGTRMVEDFGLGPHAGVSRIYQPYKGCLLVQASEGLASGLYLYDPTAVASSAPKPLIVELDPRTYPYENTVELSLSGNTLSVLLDRGLLFYDIREISSITICGQKTPDKITIGARVMGVTAYGAGGSDTIIGGGGDDTLYGGTLGTVYQYEDAGDLIQGRGGNDQILGHQGNDTLLGGGGSDSIHGGKGDDRLNGQAGNDSLRGNGGNDTLKGAGGSDLLLGGAGDDCFWSREGVADTLSGGVGDDEAQVDDPLDVRSAIELLLA